MSRAHCHAKTAPDCCPEQLGLLRDPQSSATQRRLGLPRCSEMPARAPATRSPGHDDYDFDRSRCGSGPDLGHLLGGSSGDVAVRLRSDRVRVHAGQPSFADRAGPGRDGRSGRPGNLHLGHLRGGDEPLSRRAYRPDRPADRAALDGDTARRVRRGRGARALLSHSHAGAGAARHRDRRFLVDGDLGGHAPGTAAAGAQGTRHPEWRQRSRGDGRGPARQLPRRLYRLARRFLHRRSAGSSGACLAVADIACATQRRSRER